MAQLKGDATQYLCVYMQEVRSMARARKLGVLTPVPYFVELETSSIYMEKVDGVSVKHALLNGQLDAAGTCVCMLSWSGLFTLLPLPGDGAGQQPWLLVQ